MAQIIDNEYGNWLAHIGVDHIQGNPGSGRYEWGSGEHPYQRSGFSYDDYLDMVKAGYSQRNSRAF